MKTLVSDLSLHENFVSFWPFTDLDSIVMDVGVDHILNSCSFHLDRFSPLRDEVICWISEIVPQLMCLSPPPNVRLYTNDNNLFRKAYEQLCATLIKYLDTSDIISKCMDCSSGTPVPFFNVFRISWYPINVKVQCFHESMLTSLPEKNKKKKPRIVPSIPSDFHSTVPPSYDIDENNKSPKFNSGYQMQSISKTTQKSDQVLSSDTKPKFIHSMRSTPPSLNTNLNINNDILKYQQGPRCGNFTSSNVISDCYNQQQPNFPRSLHNNTNSSINNLFNSPYEMSVKPSTALLNNIPNGVNMVDLNNDTICGLDSIPSCQRSDSPLSTCETTCGGIKTATVISSAIPSDNSMNSRMFQNLIINQPLKNNANNNKNNNNIIIINNNNNNKTHVSMNSCYGNNGSVLNDGTAPMNIKSSNITPYYLQASLPTQIHKGEMSKYKNFQNHVSYRSTPISHLLEM